jgi:hypothetical protein
MVGQPDPRAGEGAAHGLDVPAHHDLRAAWLFRRHVVEQLFHLRRGDKRPRRCSRI